MWKKDPDVYVSDLSYGIFLLMRRNFAPAAERLQSVIAREQAIPRMLEAARQNISNPPRIYTEVALQQMPGQHQVLPDMMSRRRFPKCMTRSAAGRV